MQNAAQPPAVVNRFLPPFAEGKREKPRDMLYLASDRPPWSTTLSVSIQHAIVALMLLIYSMIAGQSMGLAGAQLRDFLALGMLVMGLGTVLIAAVTLGTIFGLAVWSPGRARIFALLIGAAAGLLMAVLTGVLGGAELARVAAQPVFALPGEYYRPAPPTWVPAAIAPYLLGSIMAAVDTVGSGVMIDKMNNERWRRPDLNAIKLVPGQKPQSTFSLNLL
jgi:xanthine/uracil permease